MREENPATFSLAMDLGFMDFARSCSFSNCLRLAALFCHRSCDNAVLDLAKMENALPLFRFNCQEGEGRNEDNEG